MFTSAELNEPFRSFLWISQQKEQVVSRYVLPSSHFMKREFAICICCTIPLCWLLTVVSGRLLWCGFVVFFPVNLSISTKRACLVYIWQDKTVTFECFVDLLVLISTNNNIVFRTIWVLLFCWHFGFVIKQ